jgi:hypothetical protein
MIPCLLCLCRSLGVNKRSIGLRFCELCDDFWQPPIDADFELSLDNVEMVSE